MKREHRHSLGGKGKPPRRGGRSGVRRLIGPSLLVCVLAAFAFIAGFGLFADHIGHLSVPRDVDDADGIIVLTGGQSRIDAAVSLLKAGKGKRLLISGVNPVARADDLRIATGSEAELFDCCVDIDHAALDTIGNAEESAKWVRANAYDSIILVTNNYHMPRSLLEMRRLLPYSKVHPYPVVNTPLDNGAWLAKPDALRVLATEYTKYVGALVREVVPLPRNTPANGPAEITKATVRQD
ncbi:YdcF family protein [uncultured Nitratireductor sp.]|uniref:YdcF family protein n=1 Tax=uncultured Nitratireductor sp. TaxID=520953 RepID=UPI0025EAE6DB|nr:YdcF family protein [uncultured Nitratireductor sp.]